MITIDGIRAAGVRAYGVRAYGNTPLLITPDDRVYISGPMTGLANYNKPAFLLAEKLVTALTGAAVLNPAHQPDGHSWTHYMRQDIDLLRRASVVVALPGWQNSQGARIEIDWAIQAGLLIVEV